MRTVPEWIGKADAAAYDGQPGAPSVVLADPARVLGNQAHAVLAFWRWLDAMTAEQRDAVAVAEAAIVLSQLLEGLVIAAYAAVNSAGEAAAGNAGNSARRAGNAAAGATNEIQGGASCGSWASRLYSCRCLGLPTRKRCWRLTTLPRRPHDCDG